VEKPASNPTFSHQKPTFDGAQADSALRFSQYSESPAPSAFDGFAAPANTLPAKLTVDD
jgi:hypothetical protein